MKQRVTYIDTKAVDAVEIFGRVFYHTLESICDIATELVILCIGTDRAIGDSLGPIVGDKLAGESGIYVYGTLDDPVHAKNLDACLQRIRSLHQNSVVVAVDASLGSLEHIGFVSVAKGPVHPGAGLNKCLPPVGDVCITGIVNFSGVLDYLVLQSTRLGVVMRMADIMAAGIRGGLHLLWTKKGDSCHAQRLSGKQLEYDP